MSQAALECAVAAFSFLLLPPKRFGLRDGSSTRRGIWSDDGRFRVGFGCRGKIGEQHFQNCFPGRVGKICCVENRAQAGFNSFGFRLRLFRIHLSPGQLVPKSQDRFVSPSPKSRECRAGLGLERLVVRSENSREMPVGAFGRGVLNDDSSALTPRCERKGASARRAIGERVGNGHFDALQAAARALVITAPAASAPLQSVEQRGRQIPLRERGDDDHDVLARHGGALADLERGRDGGAG